jgi:hypothetical protein
MLVAVIDGITRFRAQNGRLPDSLDELVPAYLPRLPDAPRAASRWEYSTWGVNREHFALTVGSARLP